jgi:hypothetical protein
MLRPLAETSASQALFKVPLFPIPFIAAFHSKNADRIPLSASLGLKLKTPHTQEEDNGDESRANR